jgi:transposase InsO family protein
LIVAVFEANYRVYGRRKIKAALAREHGVVVDQDRISRLMGELGIRGAVRSKSTITTRSDRSSPRAPDLVQRRFRADHPNELWVSDFERHEVLFNRAVVKGHRHVLVAAGALKLRAA